MIELAFFALVIAAFWRVLGRAPAPARRRPGTPRTPAVVPAAPFVLTEVLERADSAYRRKAFDEAVDLYRTVLEHSPQTIMAYNRLGIIYAVRDQPQEAVACFRQATRIQPSAPTFTNLGLALSEQGEYEEATVALKAALGFDKTPDRYLALAKAYGQLHRLTPMAAALEQAAALEPTVPTLKLLLNVYTRANQPGRADQTAARLRTLERQGGQSPPRAT